MNDAEFKIKLLQNIVRKAAEQFRSYERQHLAKVPPQTEKADVNADLAEELEDALEATK